jgi:hypothetical protein
MFEILHRGSRRRDDDKETQLEIASNKHEQTKVDRNKLIAVFGREEVLIKNEHDRDASE